MVPNPTKASRKGFLKHFRDLIEDMEGCEDVDLRDSLRLNKNKVRVPIPVLPLQILLGGEEGYRLHLYPEVVIGGDGRMTRTGDYLLFEPARYFTDICGFVRLASGESITLGRDDELQRALLKYPKVVDDRHLRLKLSDKGLALKKKSTVQDACVAPLTSDDMMDRTVRWRHENFERLARVLGGALEYPSREEALDLLERVNAIMDDEPYRVPREGGGVSGLLELPDEIRPVFVGDLHAHIDNLLVVLTQNGFLESIEAGSAALILLGDAAHPDVEGQEDQMDSSMLLMDLIFRLKLRFPERVFYLRGNHDSFSADISKGGVPQGLLWEKALHEERGIKYRDAMQRFYDNLPYVVVAPGYLACHAGPPGFNVSREDLINIQQQPKLKHALTHMRIQRQNSPSGYSRGDVARLRKNLELNPETPFIVGHTPLSPDDTCWPNAGGIDHHHVLFGANDHWVAVIVRVGRHLLPLRYPVEPLLAIFNRFVHTGKGIEV